MAERDDIPYFSGPHSVPRTTSAPEPEAGPEPEVSPESASGAAPSAPETPLAVDAHDEQPVPSPPDDNPAQPMTVVSIGDDEGASPSAPESGARRTLALVAVGLAAVLVIWGLGLTVYSQRKVTTPFIVARTPDAAERILNARELAAGDARLVATREFASGLIMEQSPQTPTTLKPGSRVNVVVATATANVAVPDVFLLDQETAQKQIRSALFIPIVIDAYSSQVSRGLVASQLPRAGDQAFTGSPLFIVVSMGPGTPGVVAPTVVGKPHKVAASLIATESLFTRTLIVDAPGVAPDTVVDQIPPAGTIMPVGSSVVISLTSP